MAKNWSDVFSRIRAALRRRGRTEHDAEDLVQEAWIRLECASRTKTVDHPEAFLMQTALNLSIDWHRKRQCHGEEVAIEDEILVDTAPGLEESLLARERLHQLVECMSRLDSRTRAILLAHRLEGMSYLQIAEQHRLSVSSVEKYVAKATLQLTSWLEEA
jgi:RNA polymerase sigma factor (sigma-70 family)